MHLQANPAYDERIALAVVAKAPIPGVAKTRLGAAVGHQRAAALYRGFLADTLAILDETAEQFRHAERIVVGPNREHAARLRDLASPAWRVSSQNGSGLMAGIVEAFEICFALGAESVVVADADSPLALLTNLDECIALVGETDLVLGPTRDGGYYLIAATASARNRLANLLLGETFDSTTICAVTAARARLLGLDVSLGPPDFDVDTIEDLQHFTSRLASIPASWLPHSREALQSDALEKVGG